MFIYKAKNSISLRVVSVVLIATFIMSGVAVAFTDASDSALAPPLATKPPCQIIYDEQSGECYVITNDDVIESWDKATMQSARADEILGKAFRNRWAFVDISYLIAQMLILTQEHKLQNPKDILIPLIKKHIQNRDGMVEMRLEGYDVDGIAEVREGNEIKGFALPVTRNGTLAYRLVYNLQGGDIAIQMKDGMMVWLKVEIITATTQEPKLSDGLRIFGGKYAIYTQMTATKFLATFSSYFNNESALIEAKRFANLLSLIEVSNSKNIFECQLLATKANGIFSNAGFKTYFRKIRSPRPKDNQLYRSVDMHIVLIVEIQGKPFLVDPSARQFEIINMEEILELEDKEWGITQNLLMNIQSSDIGLVIMPLDVAIDNPDALWLYHSSVTSPGTELKMSTPSKMRVTTPIQSVLESEPIHATNVGIKSDLRPQSPPSISAPISSLFNADGIAINAEGRRLAIMKYQDALNCAVNMVRDIGRERGNPSIKVTSVRNSFGQIGKRLPRLGIYFNHSILEAQILALHKKGPSDIDIVIPLRNYSGAEYTAINDSLDRMVEEIFRRCGIIVHTYFNEPDGDKNVIPIERLVGNGLLNLVESHRAQTIPQTIPDSERIHAKNLQDAFTYIQTQPQSQPLIVALGTSWIKGYEKGRYLQYDALNPLIGSIRTYCESRGIPFIAEEDDKLLARINAERAKEGKAGAKVAVLAGKDTAVSDDFATLRNDQENAIVVGVDNQELTTDSYIRLMEMLTLALKLSAGLEISLDNAHITITKDNERHLYIFLPHAEPMDYEQLKITYEVQKFA